MRSKLVELLIAVAVMAGSSAIVQAALISGGMSLSGNYTVNAGGNLNIATGFVSFSNVQVTSVAGDYVGKGITMYTRAP